MMQNTLMLTAILISNCLIASVCSVTTQEDRRSSVFHEGMAPIFWFDNKNSSASPTAGIIKNTKVSYINSHGKLIKIPKNNYCLADTFHGGVARVAVFSEKNGIRYGAINSDFRMTIPSKYYSLGPHKEGLLYFASSENEMYGYMNSKGDVVIEPKYRKACSFSEGMAAVSNGSQYGYIDKNGRLVIPYQFSHAKEFSEGVAAVGVLVEGKLRYGFIDSQGKWVIQPKYVQARSFSEGLCAVKTESGSWRYIDQHETTMLQTKFHEIMSFSEGKASVRLFEQYAVINRMGKLILPFNYTKIGYFSEGLARAFRGDFDYGYIKESGEYIFRRYLANDRESKKLRLTFSGDTQPDNYYGFDIIVVKITVLKDSSPYKLDGRSFHMVASKEGHKTYSIPLFHPLPGRFRISLVDANNRRNMVERGTVEMDITELMIKKKGELVISFP